ncbi:uncharacterized protein LOC116287814 [Actinia tenebrosa]|uniref:Uncharacterized protein LOC116287814 n=1 Tax=Actinia tenebrosa TaxID=6105 RepID=A0A6P8HCH0_ACTTE|nr:uncharacterized protein LOC116287814 [Actinia tenebrosa]
MATGSGGGAVGIGEKESGLLACLDELRRSHDKETVKIALETLLKLANNAIQRPNDEKFRHIRVENKAFNAKVWSLPEAQQFLMVWGWVETDDGHIDLSVNDVKQVLQKRLSSVPSPKPKSHDDQPMTEKEKMLQEERRLLQEQAKAEKAEKERIKAQIRADRENVKKRESKASKATHLHGGGHMTKFKDIGIDLDKGGGG